MNIKKGDVIGKAKVYLKKSKYQIKDEFINEQKNLIEEKDSFSFVDNKEEYSSSENNNENFLIATNHDYKKTKIKLLFFKI